MWIIVATLAVGGMLVNVYPQASDARGYSTRAKCEHVRPSAIVDNRQVYRCIYVPLVY